MPFVGESFLREIPFVEESHFKGVRRRMGFPSASKQTAKVTVLRSAHCDSRELVSPAAAKANVSPRHGEGRAKAAPATAMAGHVTQ